MLRHHITFTITGRLMLKTWVVHFCPPNPIILSFLSISYPMKEPVRSNYEQHSHADL